MAIRIEKGGWILIFLIGLSLVGYSLYRYGLLDARWLDVIIPAAKVREAKVPAKAELPPAAVAQSPAVAPVAPPGTKAGCTERPEVRFLHWAWNAQMGLMFATGGSQAATGSLMCGKGVNLRLVREDDPNKMQEQLVAFASELKGGVPHPAKGAHFVGIMGDGSAAFLQGVNTTLRKLGPEYVARVVGSAGYSRGEDKFMGPPEWKASPTSSRGGVVAGVLRDGDWNIAQKWLGDNGLCNNPDEKTYDPGCLNWVATPDYLDAAAKYIAGYCDTRPVVSKGKRTGETKKVCVNGVVTWTPGDVNVASQRGGLVSVVSTREYSSQMPHVIIGIDRWMRSNRALVEGMLEAVFDGGDQVKGNPGALKHAAAVSAVVYNEKGTDAGYWEKYFQVVVERDRAGLAVELGGSAVNNLADNLLLFGLVQGSANLFAATYKVFGDIVVNQYQDLVPSYAPVGEILDTAYVEAIARRAPPKTIVAEAPRYAADPMRAVVSRRAWQITFETGKATLTPDGQRRLDQLLRDLLVAGGTVVEVHGHTDSVGTPPGNQALSEERAFAVKQWLEQQSPVNFPSGRVRVFAHGQANPVAPNSTPEGRAQNRRVEIVLGTTGG